MDIVTPDWVKDAVFYQIFPDRFAKSHQFGQNGYPMKPTNLQSWGSPPTGHGFQGGDLLGVVEKLDYLSDLGINAIYLNPIFASASNHRYHTHDYYTVDPLLGGNRAFKVLLDAAHERGMRVVLDGVFNHASRGFFQFNHLLECGADSPYVDWFHVNEWPLHAYSDSHGPNYAAWWGIPALPKFNTDTPAVREFLLNVATYWLAQGIDGWRLDVPNEIDDDAFWQEFRRRCKAVNPEAYIVGELWEEADRWLQGDQFDAQMNYLFTRAAYGFFVGSQMDRSEIETTGYGKIPSLTSEAFARQLTHMFNELYHPQVVQAQMNMLGSHDTPRMLTVVNEDVELVRLLFLCLMTVPGAPNIYYGDEIGLPGKHDPDCRRAFPWEARETWNEALLADVRQFIGLRHETPALRRGDFQIVHVGEQLIMYRRQIEGQTAVVAFNIGEQPIQYTVPDDFEGRLTGKLGHIGNPVFAAGETVSILGKKGCVWTD